MQTKPKESKPPEEVENGHEKLSSEALANSTIALAGVAITNKAKNGNLTKAPQAKLSDIKFNKGVAYSIADNEKFTGVVTDKLGNGDSIKLTYKNGLLQSSKRTGTKNIIKGYEYNKNGRVSQVAIFEGEQFGIVKYSYTRSGKIASITKRNKVAKFKYYSPDDKGEEKIQTARLADKTERGWYQDGQKEYEELADGTKRRWYKGGQKQYEKLPNGTRRTWYKDGQMKSEELPDKTNRNWYRNGQIDSEILPDGSYTTWNKQGQIIKQEKV